MRMNDNRFLLQIVLLVSDGGHCWSRIPDEISLPRGALKGLNSYPFIYMDSAKRHHKRSRGPDLSTGAEHIFVLA